MINAAVVGYGYAGRSFHTYLIPLADGLNLYAVSTRDAARREAAAKERGVKTYASIDDLLKDDNVDLIVLATPHNTHAELAIKAMDAGKHVVTDKAMCMNAAEADAMIETSKRNNVMLSVFHNRRWDWDYLTVKKVIADGMIGEPFYFESTIMRYGPPRGWRGVKAQSGGIMYDWGAHLLDHALQLVPSAVERVSCEIQYRGWDIDVGSYGKLLLHFQNGVLYQIEISNLARVDKPRWYVLGETGGLIKYGLDPQEDPMVKGDIDAATENPAQRARVFTEVNGEVKEIVIDSVRGSWKSYYQNISDVLNKGAELAVKPEEARRAMMIYDAAMKSADTGETIKVNI
ncbi:TPA: dehydrogenase [Candidatus Poribacteria bacterium]|nr:dehydrogenase [Candidatus Poribacteria bacterium]